MKRNLRSQRRKNYRKIHNGEMDSEKEELEITVKNDQEFQQEDGSEGESLEEVDSEEEEGEILEDKFNDS